VAAINWLEGKLLTFRKPMAKPASAWFRTRNQDSPAEAEIPQAICRINRTVATFSLGFLFAIVTVCNDPL
jgi:hypothetical protein